MSLIELDINTHRGKLTNILMILIFVLTALVYWIYSSPKEKKLELHLGTDVDFTEFPFAVYFTPDCPGGSILDKHHVITIRSCNATEVIVGEINRFNFFAATKNSISKSIQHPDPNIDISIKYMKEPFQFNSKVKPVILPRNGYDTPHKLKVIGWYPKSYNCTKIHTKILQKAIVEVEESEGWIINSSDACIGDIGSGAVQKMKGGNYTLIGVVSETHSEIDNGCQSKNYYVKIADIVNWIQSIMHNKRKK